MLVHVPILVLCEKVLSETQETRCNHSVTWISGECRLGLYASLHSCAVTKVSTFLSVRGVLYWFFVFRSSFSARADGDSFDSVFRNRLMPLGTDTDRGI